MFLTQKPGRTIFHHCSDDVPKLTGQRDYRSHVTKDDMCCTSQLRVHSCMPRTTIYDWL